MSTRPKNDPANIAKDARQVLHAAQEDAHHKEFSARVSKHELNAFAHDIEALESGNAARTTRLHAKVAAGVHVAEVRANILHVASDVRDDVKIHFPGEDALAHQFGVGFQESGGSTTEVRELAHTLIDAAHARPDVAKKVGLDAHGIHDLEHMIAAIDAAEHAHVLATTRRHDASTATDSLAHKVQHEAAHLRLIARRVFKTDASKLDRYKSTLPRHEVTPRKKPEASAPAK